ncbi:MAG: recombinase family protein [Acidimicrobiia bacterium]
MNLSAYIRVSTDSQAEHGQGLDVQRSQVETWATENGHQIIHWYSDEGISGYGDLDIRDGLLEAIGSVSYNGSEGLLVPNTGRLARDSVNQELAMREVWKAGGKVFAADRGEILQDDPERPLDSFTRKLLALIDELDGRMISLRLRKGRANKAANGGFAYGSPPFGWASREGELVEHPEEQQTLTTIKALREQGHSYASIAEELNLLGLKSKRGGDWHPSTVSRVLKKS